MTSRGQAAPTMKVYGHPWSTNTRKILLTLAEKGRHAELVLVMLPTGEHRRPEHVARHPFAKVPVLEHDGLVLYETSAIARYLDRVLEGPPLVPSDPRDAARVDQWIAIAEAYLAPHAQPLIVESLFRRYLGGPQNVAAITAGREAIAPALDAANRRLADAPYLGGPAFSLADIQWMPYLDYLGRIGEGGAIARREHLAAWWDRGAARPSWHAVAHTGPQPDEPGMSAEVIEAIHRAS